jgi:hypothetical protein
MRPGVTRLHYNLRLLRHVRQCDYVVVPGTVLMYLQNFGEWVQYLYLYVIRTIVLVP